MSEYVNAPISHWSISGGDLDGVPYIFQVSGYSDSTPSESVAYQDAQGNPIQQNWYSRQVPTGQLSVRRLLDSNTAFADARVKVKNGEYEKTEITITQMTATGDPVKTIALTGAIPTGHRISDLSSSQTEQQWEELELTFDTAAFS
jgi:hypothetical protein